MSLPARANQEAGFVPTPRYGRGSDLEVILEVIGSADRLPHIVISVKNQNARHLKVTHRKALCILKRHDGGETRCRRAKLDEETGTWDRDYRLRIPSLPAYNVSDSTYLVKTKPTAEAERDREEGGARC